jgi:hypothetical protein
MRRNKKDAARAYSVFMSPEPDADVRQQSRKASTQETWWRRRSKRKTDLLVVLATEGSILAVGSIIYGTYLGNQSAYYWSILGLAVAVSSVSLLRWLRPKLPS